MPWCVLQDIGADVSQVSRRWLEDGPTGGEVRTPDMDGMDMDQYQNSLTQYVMPSIRALMPYVILSTGILTQFVIPSTKMLSHST